MDFKELIQSIANAPKVQLSSNVLIIVITIFVVPSLALSPYLLLAMFWALKDCLSNFLTNSHFYYFLLNFLIVTLVFTSGVLDEQGEEKEMSLQDESEHSDNDNDDKHHHCNNCNTTSSHMTTNENITLDQVYETTEGVFSPLKDNDIEETTCLMFVEDVIINNSERPKNSSKEDNVVKTYNMKPTCPCESTQVSLNMCALGTNIQGSEFELSHSLSSHEDNLITNDCDCQNQQGYISKFHHAIDSSLVTFVMEYNQLENPLNTCVESSSSSLEEITMKDEGLQIIPNDDNVGSPSDINVGVGVGVDIDISSDVNGYDNERDGMNISTSKNKNDHNELVKDYNKNDNVNQTHGSSNKNDMSGMILDEDDVQPHVISIEEENYDMSREELNERVNAFISNFRKKLMTSSLKDD